MITDTTFFTNEPGYALLDPFKKTLEQRKRYCKVFRSGIDIFLCKEQPEIWKALGLGMKGLSCNCVKLQNSD